VPHIDPDKDEKAEVGTDNRVIKVVKGLGCLMGNRLVVEGYNMREQSLTARKKSLISCVIYTAKPMYVKWKR
jgi:hypothetical protein